MNKLFYFQKAKRNPLWKNVSNKDWLNYEWQIKNRVSDPKVLQQALNLTDEETKRIEECITK